LTHLPILQMQNECSKKLMRIPRLAKSDILDSMFNF
jgi:hypothetical protein